jgi:hypothetical protein
MADHLILLNYLLFLVHTQRRALRSYGDLSRPATAFVPPPPLGTTQSPTQCSTGYLLGC